MSSKGAQPRWIVACVLVLALVVVAAIVFGVGHELPALVSSAAPASVTTAPVALVAEPSAASEAPASNAAPLEIAPPDERAPVASAAREIASEELPRAILRGRIVSSRTDLARAEIEVARRTGDDRLREAADGGAQNGRWIRAAVGNDGGFEVEVTELALRWIDLHVTARHPALKTTTETVSTAPVRRAKPGERVELAVTIVMSDAICRVRGRVATETDEPASSSVAAFEVRDGALVAATADAQQETKKHGAFELELSPLPHVLLAYARDWRPATVRVVCSEGETLELSPIVLDRGFTISGQALLGSAPFAAGMMVAADVERPVSLASAGNSSFAWTGERFEWARRQTRANDIGLYEITALRAGTYSLRLIGVGDPGTPIFDVEPISVLAPASDVELSPGLCELRVTTFKAGVRTATRFTIRETTSRFSQRFCDYASDLSGRATVWIVPNRLTDLVVDRGETSERVFSVPACNVRDGIDLRIDL